MTDQDQTLSWDAVLQKTFGELYDAELQQARGTLRLGRIDASSGYPNHDVTISLRLRIEDVSGSPLPVFSVQGEIVNLRKRTYPVEAGGQIQELIDGHLRDPRWPQIKRLWDLHHLNHMHAECSHMREIGWLPEPGRPMPKALHHGVETFIGQLRPAEHPDGILGKECPQCGYRYGTRWLYQPIPEPDLTLIAQIMASENKKEKQR